MVAPPQRHGSVSKVYGIVARLGQHAFREIALLYRLIKGLFLRYSERLEKDINAQANRQADRYIIKIDENVENVCVIFVGWLVAAHRFASHSLAYVRDHTIEPPSWVGGSCYPGTLAQLHATNLGLIDFGTDPQP